MSYLNMKIEEKSVEIFDLQRISSLKWDLVQKRIRLGMDPVTTENEWFILII